MTRIVLNGCTCEPLGSYLKSLAVLRLLAEQKDPSIKGWWEDGTFCIDSTLDRTGIERFFLEEYRPTPIVAPWNGGSGFYEGDNRTGLEAIRNSRSPRYESYRKAINDISSWPEMPSSGLPIGELIKKLESVTEQKSGKAQKDLLEFVDSVKESHPNISRILKTDVLSLTIEQVKERKNSLQEGDPGNKQQVNTIGDFSKILTKIRTQIKRIERSAGKYEIVQACRDRLGPEALQWVDAAVIIDNDDTLSWPPILGSAGGNEGRFDYTNTFMENIRQLLIDNSNPGDSIALLKNSLFGDRVNAFVIQSVGQFDPGRAGGYNQGFGIEKKEFPTNPWNLILTLEGTIIWASSFGQKNSADKKGFLKSPFTVRGKPVGTLSQNDEGIMRAELWTPLWQNPLKLLELKTFIGEGRSTLGKRSAANTLEFAEAVSSLGIDRGVTEFIRHDLLKRRGDSYIALPAGRFPVTYRRESDLIRELDRILQILDRYIRNEFKKNIPASITSARHRIDIAVYDALLYGGAGRIKNLLATIGQMEQILARMKKSPKLYTGLSPRWIADSDDGTLELRIAAALASIRATGKVGSIRENLEHRDPNKPDQTAWNGNTLSERLASVLARRMMDADRLGCTSNPLDSVISLVPEDIASFIGGDTDDRLVQDLFFGLTWVRWNDDAKGTMVQELKESWKKPVNQGSTTPVPRSWALLKLLFLPRPIRREGFEAVIMKPERSLVPLILARRTGDACDVARRRLIASGFLPVKARFSDTENAERIAAALLVPVRDAGRLMRMVLEDDLKTKRG